MRWVPDNFVRDPCFSPPPLYTFLVKIASRCNLNCSYCYVYQTPDDSWRSKPSLISDVVVARTAQRIAEHVRQHDLSDISIVFHGGEPLLAGPKRIARFAKLFRDTIPCRITFGMQSNGLLLRAETLDVLASFGFQLGISIDGDRRANDLNRIDHQGRSSFEAVMRAIELARSRPEWHSVLGGFLAVVDLRLEPDDVYEFMLRISARSIDLLLPDAHHDSPPPRDISPDAGVAYGRWLARFFDRWYREQPELDIRYFDEILVLLLGGNSSLEAIGAKSVDLVVIETNGDIEAVDTLKIVGRNATYLGMNVFDHTFDQVLRHPAIWSRMVGYAALSTECRNCSDLQVCGGGYLPHRFGHGRGFINPSVYCSDLRYLFAHIRSRVSADLSAIQ